MSGKENEKEFNHDKAGVVDKIRLISELEHSRSHCLRAAVSVYEEGKDDHIKYLILAKKAQSLRREYMRKHFGDLKDPDWCLCKSAACIRQIAYEVCEVDAEELRELDDFVDEVWGGALEMDLSDCQSCVEDKNTI